MPRSLLLANCRTLHAPEPVSVRVRDGSIAGITSWEEDRTCEPILDVGGRTLIPGLIDVHVHGAGGADILDGTPEALKTISRTLARLGTTSFLGTTVVQPGQDNDHLRVAAEHVGANLGGAHLLGLHLEGPFVNPEKRGGLPLSGIYPPSPAALEKVLALTAGTLRVMTIAPELDGSLSLIERLTAEGVVASFGHSNADYEQTRAGIAAGIRHVTHLYNAMPGLHHRAPGPLVAIFEAEDIPVEVISDDVHVNRHVIRWTRQVLGGERCMCVTDGMRTAGLPEGRYTFGEREFESRNGTARYLDGTLIGTSLSLREVVMRFQDYTGCSFAAAVDSATRIPAKMLGIDDRKGSIEPGKDADLVILDEDGSVWATLVGGEIVYRSASAESR
jgi:N-acetylglucosamine-6-phosphate deacetylase